MGTVAWLLALIVTSRVGAAPPIEGESAERAATPSGAQDLSASVAQAERYYRAMGYGSFAPGNAEGGLSSQEEKSAGAYAKSGSRPISLTVPYSSRRLARKKSAQPPAAGIRCSSDPS